MQKENLIIEKRIKGTIKEQPIGTLSKKQIERYFKKEFGKELIPHLKFNPKKNSKNFLQVREEYSKDLLLELLGAELFEQVFVNPISKADKESKFPFENDIMTAEEESQIEYMQFSRIDRKRLSRKGGYCVDKNGAIVLMAKIKVMRRVIGALNLEGSKADKSKQADDMINTSATSEYVSIDPTEITEALGYSKALRDSNAASGEQALTNLTNSLQAILFQFQNFANSNPDKALAAFKSGNFSTKTLTARQKQPWGVKNTVNAGIMRLTANGGPLRSAHDWWISLDGKIFTRLCPTIAADTIVVELEEGQYVYFMHQLITKDGPQGFDFVIKKMVATL